MNNSNAQTIRATVERLEPVLQRNGAMKSRPGRYRLTLAATGETIIHDSKVPMFDACRVLNNRGVTGTLEVWWQGASFAAFRTDIEKGAGWTVIESRLVGPRLAKWQPFEMSPEIAEDDEFVMQHDREMVPA